MAYLLLRIAYCLLPSSIQIKIANRLACIRSVLGALHRFLKLAFEQVGLISFGIDGLAEERFFAAFLLAHGAGRLLEVGESFRTYWRSVRNDCSGFWIDLQQRSAARASHLKRFYFCFSHTLKPCAFAYADDSAVAHLSHHARRSDWISSIRRNR